MFFFLCTNLNYWPRRGIILQTTTYQQVACLQSPSLHIMWLRISLKISPKLKWGREPGCATLFSADPFSVSANGGWVPQPGRSTSHADAQAWARHLRRRWCSLFWRVTTTKTKTECFSRGQKGKWHLFSTLGFAFCRTPLELQTLCICDQERQTVIAVYWSG